MKTRTALVLSVAGVLLTGSAALAVNTQTLGNPSPDFTGTSDEVLLPQNATTPTGPGPSGTVTPAPSDTPLPSPRDDSSTAPRPTEGASSADDHGVDDKSKPDDHESEDESSDDDD